VGKQRQDHDGRRGDQEFDVLPRDAEIKEHQRDSDDADPEGRTVDQVIKRRRDDDPGGGGGIADGGQENAGASRVR